MFRRNATERRERERVHKSDAWHELVQQPRSTRMLGAGMDEAKEKEVRRKTPCKCFKETPLVMQKIF